MLVGGEGGGARVPSGAEGPRSAATSRAPPVGRVPSFSVSTVVSGSPSRSWGRAFADLAAGWEQRQLWGHLGWQDIKQRYRRSVLGPIWISITMAVTAISLGILYAGLFNIDLAVQLPYVLVGFIIWGFISGCIAEGSEVFTSNVGLITHLPAPLSVHVYRLLWRQTLFFAHNLLVYAVMLVIYPPHFTWPDLAAFPAFGLLLANGAWVALLLGIVTTRFRDLVPITQSIVQLAFYMTPIVWFYETLRTNPNPAIRERAALVQLNPFFHFLEILRRPMLGEPQLWHSWIVVLCITVAGWAVTLVILRRYRARVSYWV
jgi:ABC-2 type transport system permease protein